MNLKIKLVPMGKKRKPMPILIVSAGVLLLLLLITVARLNAFIAFVLVSLFVGVAGGLPILDTVRAIESGVGKTLSSLVMILGFGAMLGKLVADSGAALQITQRLVAIFGIKNVQWALIIAGFIVGIPLFYSVGFVILVPLVFTIAASTGLPLLYVGIPMLAALSVTHGFLPPHPAPTAIAESFNADVGKTLLLGLLAALPPILIIVPLFAKWSKKYDPQPLEEFYQTEEIPESKMPSLAVSLFTASLPVILIGLSTVVRMVTPVGSGLHDWAGIIGNPVLAMLATVLVAIYLLGIKRGRTMDHIMASLVKAISSITMVLLIIGGAGALKEVLVESQVSEYIGKMLESSTISPLVLAWLIAAAIRVSVGSATVAGLTAAGIVLPLVTSSGTSPELMVLAIGAGSIFLSHVNDGGFWLFKEYFNLSIKETLLTWSVMETTVSIVGLFTILLIDLFV